jgi:hypothetical protein
MPKITEVWEGSTAYSSARRGLWREAKANAQARASLAVRDIKKLSYWFNVTGCRGGQTPSF